MPRSECVLRQGLNVNRYLSLVEFQNLITLMSSHCFLQYMTTPTRFAKHNLPFLIDHISYNNTHIQYCGTISIDFTDHTPCTVLVKTDVSIDKIEQNKI